MMMTIIAVWRFVCLNSVCAGNGPEFGYCKSGQVVKLHREGGSASAVTLSLPVTPSI